MANWADTRERKYSEYVGAPVDTYFATGMYKQSMYEQGIQQIQTALSTVAGLEIARDVDKNYLNSKVSEVTSKINSIGGGDWSNKNLVSKATGIATTVAKDQYVQDAVYSTEEYKNRLETLKKVREKGDGYSPQNEWDYLNDVNAWMSDPAVGKKLGHKEYANYVDLNETALKYFKDKHPNTIVRQNPVTGEMAAYVLNEGKETYISATDVQNEFRAMVSSDPKLSNQLRINTQFNLQGQDPAKYFGRLDEAYKKNIDALGKKKEELLKEKSTITDPELIASYEKQIKELESSSIPSLNNKYNQIKDSYLKDPASFMYQTEQENYFASIGDHYAYSQSEHKLVENPVGKIAYEHAKDEKEFELKWAKLRQDEEIAKNKNKAPDAASFGVGPLNNYDAVSFANDVQNQSKKVESDLVTLLQMDDAGAKYIQPVTNPDGSQGYKITDPIKAKEFALERSKFYQENRGNDLALANAWRKYADDVKEVNKNQKAIIDSENEFYASNPDLKEKIKDLKLDDPNTVVGTLNNQSYTQKDVLGAISKYNSIKNQDVKNALKTMPEKEAVLIYNLYIRDNPGKTFLNSPIIAAMTADPSSKSSLIHPEMGVFSGRYYSQEGDKIWKALNKTKDVLGNEVFKKKTEFMNNKLGQHFKNENNYFHPLNYEDKNDKTNALTTINTIANGTGFGQLLPEEYFKNAEATSIATKKGTSEGHDVIVYLSNPNVNGGAVQEIPMSLKNASLIDPSIKDVYTPKTKMEKQLMTVPLTERIRIDKNKPPYESSVVGDFLLNSYVRVNPTDNSISIVSDIIKTNPDGTKKVLSLPANNSFTNYTAAEIYLNSLKNPTTLQKQFELYQK